MLTTFLVPADVLDLLTDESKADAYLVTVAAQGIGDSLPDDVQQDARRALAVLARRARDRMSLPVWEIR